MAKKKFLNVRDHLEHVKLVLDGLEEHGMCAVLEEEMNKLRLVNNAMLLAHDKKRATGNRKDIC